MSYAQMIACKFISHIALGTAPTQVFNTVISLIRIDMLHLRLSLKRFRKERLSNKPVHPVILAYTAFNKANLDVIAKSCVTGQHLPNTLIPVIKTSYTSVTANLV